MVGIFNRIKKSTGPTTDATPSAASAEEKQPMTEQQSVAKKAVATKTDSVVIGKTAAAYRVLVKPIVSEKAAEFGAVGKYVFAVASDMNKVEVKKAIRTIYGVEPLAVNISNVRGRVVRFGRAWGRTKAWKKAVITLKPGDKIEVYEGV